MDKGDRVLVTESYDRNNRIKNKTGTIIYKIGNMVGIKFDEFIDGHSGSFNSVENGYCWNVPEAICIPLNKNLILTYLKRRENSS